MRPLALLLAAALVGCDSSSGSAPRLQGMSPAIGEDESRVEVEIVGEGFVPKVFADFSDRRRSAVDSGYRARLVPADSALPQIELEEVRLESSQALRAQVPAGVARGFYSLEVIDPFELSSVLSEVYRVVRSPSRVVSYRLGPLGPQRAGASFAVSVAAIDLEGAVVDGFSGTLQLTDRLGAVSPEQIGPFSLGRLRAQVAIHALSASELLTVTDQQRRSGRSNEFAVLPGLAVQLAFAEEARTLPVGQCSGAVQLETRDSAGLPTPLEVAVKIRLAAAPVEGFSFYADPACTEPSVDLSIPAKASRASFSFRGESAGPVQIRAVADLLPVAFQTQTLTAPAP